MTKFILIFFLLANCAFSQPIINWQKCYGGSNRDEGSSLIKNGNGFILFGRSMSHDDQISGNYGLDDLALIWIDSSGNFIRSTHYGGSENDYSKTLIRTNDGNIIMTSATSSSNHDVTGFHGAMDIWVVKVDSTGSIIWERSLGGSSVEWASYGVVSTADSGCILIGTTPSIDGDITLNHGYYDIWVVKLNKNGVIEWQKCYGGSMWDTGFAVIVTSDNGILIGGDQGSFNGQVNCENHGGESDAWLLKLDSVGNIIWQNCYGGTDMEPIVDIIENEDGSFTCLGNSKSNDGQVFGNHGELDLWVIKVDNTGSILWSKCYGGSNNDRGLRMKKSDNGSYLICAYTCSFDGDVVGNHSIDDLNPDGWLIKISHDGTLLWQKCFGGRLDDYIVDFIESPQGKIFAVGYTRSVDLSGNVDCNIHGQGDFWFLSLTDTLTVGIDKDKTTDDYFSVYPNPSQGSVNITIDKTNGPMTLVIIDILGRVVYSEIVTQPSETIIWLPESPGMYILTTRENPLMRKKLIIH